MSANEIKTSPAQWNNSRGARERFIVRGALILETPAHFGSGEADALTDMPLLRDPLEGRALLTGSTIAGALRNYLREIELGYGREERRRGETLAEKLFGHLDKADPERERTVQSWLMVNDALGDMPRVELRDMVALDSKTRTAQDKKKFDMELVTAGTTFPLEFELWRSDENPQILSALARALQGFENGEITLGKRKRRGFGQCRVKEWTVKRFRMSEPRDILAWLDRDMTGARPGERIAELLDLDAAAQMGWEKADRRELFSLSAVFQLESSLLIRSDTGGVNEPDFVHLKSRRGAGNVPILSGTSAAGAMRARAQRIANTLGLDTNDLLEGMFGKGENEGQARTGARERDKPRGSRLQIAETEIEQPLQPELVQSRVKIDRFTGGAFPQALFQEAPVWANAQTRVTINIELRAPDEPKRFEREIGLLLLVLKDLWTGDLPLGGESSVGRGRLRGVRADLKLGKQEWTIEEKQDAASQAEKGALVISSKNTTRDLQDFVTALNETRGAK